MGIQITLKHFHNFARDNKNYKKTYVIADEKRFLFLTKYLLNVF
jgi:hypothetical protein